MNGWFLVTTKTITTVVSQTHTKDGKINTVVFMYQSVKESSGRPVENTNS